MPLLPREGHEPALLSLSARSPTTQGGGPQHRDVQRHRHAERDKERHKRGKKDERRVDRDRVGVKKSEIAGENV